MKITFSILSLMISLIGYGQDSLIHVIKQAKVSGYARSFYMANMNQGELQDWNALTLGGMLKVESGSYKGMKLGAAYYHSSLLFGNPASRDLTTNKPSRYILGLLDVQDPTKRHIPLLGELYFNFNQKGHNLTVGRMKLKTPFLNPEDGRMIPVLQQGIWYTNSQINKIQLVAGWITHMAPRSYSKFETTANTMGIYPVGLNPDGTKSGYFGNVNSAGLGVIGVKVQKGDFGIQMWDYLLENVYNTNYWLATYSRSGSDLKWISGIQGMVQNRLNHGGNSDQTKTYFHDDLSLVWGIQQKLIAGGWTFSANFNQITNHGRFMFPREWGRETLFVFQKRERIEGMSDMTAWMIDLEKKVKTSSGASFSAKIGYSHYYRADVRDFAKNKYAMPANDQFNIDLFYHLSGPLKGLVVEYLLSHKRSLGETYDNPNFILHKVEMSNHNVVMNYRF
ncbi:MAG: OprD family outer membrane porin [Cyclobacteriaceae bacterium]